MPRKVSHLLTRVLSREHDARDDASSSSGSGEDYGLQHIAANASAGLRMEMEMVKESRARDSKDGVDRNACIVDRSQFFNTQIGVGYQHKTVVRQRTAEPYSSRGRVVDMSVEKQMSKGKKRQRENDVDESTAGESACRDGDGDGDGEVHRRKKRDKKPIKSKKSKSKNRKNDRTVASKKAKKSKKEKRRKKHRRQQKSPKPSRRNQESGNVGSSSDDGSHSDLQRRKPSSRSYSRKKNIRGTKNNGKSRGSAGLTGVSVGPDSDVSPKLCSSVSSTSGSSDCDSVDDDDRDSSKLSNAHNSLHLSVLKNGSDGVRDGSATNDERLNTARGPLQHLRNLIEVKLRAKVRESKSKGDFEERTQVAGK